MSWTEYLYSGEKVVPGLDPCKFCYLELEKGQEACKVGSPVRGGGEKMKQGGGGVHIVFYSILLDLS